MSDELTKEDFLRCVNKHEMTVLVDNGVYRHLRFKAPDTGNQYFELVTFPGRLVYCGDMGSYLFERTEDMFQFFRRADRGINLSYWAEKVRAYGDGVTEFSSDKAKEIIKEIVLTKVQNSDELTEVQIDDELEELLKEIAGAEDVSHAIRLASDFESDTIKGDWFCYLWEYSFEVYTYRFQWACFAIAWGIEQYDKQAKGEVIDG